MNKQLNNLVLLFLLIIDLRWASEGMEILDVGDPIVLSPNLNFDVIEFGFSLGVFKNKTHQRLLVGAPLSQSSQNVNTPGALYSCNILQQKDWKCQRLEVDTRADSDKYSPFVMQDLKENQRLGASLAVNGEHIVVCAPNWHYYDQRINSVYDNPVGLCFKSSSLDYFEMFSPPFDIKGRENIDYLSTGSCQTGFSISLNEGNSAVLGGPGCYGWQGDIWSQTNGNWIRFGQNFTRSQFGLSSSWDPSSQYLKARIYDTYLGYSVSEGIFGGRKGIVAGMPRAIPQRKSNLYQIHGPRVVVYLQENDWLSVWDIVTPPLNPSQLKRMTWTFSYFGYSVAVIDVNHDKLDDIIVGAPFYCNETHRDLGAILIYLQHADGSVNKMILEGDPFREGQVEDGRFGSSISVVGDIDGDGFQDVAVGAPYSSDGGRIYLFLGSKTGLSMKPNQVIDASDQSFNSHSLSAFGSSISNGDFRVSDDILTRNDLAVGAPRSDKVILMRSRPSLTVSWSIVFSTKMNMQSKCPFGKSQSFPCVNMTTCGSYGFLSPEEDTTHRLTREFRISHVLDVKFPVSRLRFKNLRWEKSASILFKYQKETCTTETLYSLQVDNLEPYEVHSEIVYESGYNDKTILDFRQMTKLSSLLEIGIKCKSGSISSCISDIRLTTEPKPETVNIEIGSYEIFFDVMNNAETAYYNKLMLDHGDFLEVSGKAEVLKSSTVNLGVECFSVSSGKTECSLGTFLYRGDKLSFKINLNIMSSLLLPSNLRRHPSNLEVISTITSLSEILSSSTATSTTRVKLKADLQLDLTKSSVGTEFVHYNSSDYFITPSDSSLDANHSSQIGTEVIHAYHIYNPSSFAIENVQIDLYWPLNISGSYLLYLSEPPKIPGTLSENCTVVNSTGAIIEAMIDLPLVDQIEWYCVSCMRKLILPKEEILIHIRGLFVHSTLKSLGQGTALDRVNSFVNAEAKPIIFGELKYFNVSSSFETAIAYDYAKPRTEITYWVYIVSIVIACIIIAVLVFILYKCNFFARKKPIENEEEIADQTEMEEFHSEWIEETVDEI